jgi:uncharacterized membrane protein
MINKRGMEKWIWIMIILIILGIVIYFIMVGDGGISIIGGGNTIPQPPALPD